MNENDKPRPRNCEPEFRNSDYVKEGKMDVPNPVKCKKHLCPLVIENGKRVCPICERIKATKDLPWYDRAGEPVMD